MRACIYIYLYIYIYVGMYIYIYIYMYIYIYVAAVKAMRASGTEDEATFCIGASKYDGHKYTFI